METGWIFPYEEIERESRIIIYGAGNVGKCLYKQIWRMIIVRLLCGWMLNFKSINQWVWL